MKDIIEDPHGWSRKAVGTPLRVSALIVLHALLLGLGFVLDQPAFFAAGGLALPALYLYAMYRLLRTSQHPS